MRARLEFLRMRKYIDVPLDASSYKVVLPIGIAPAAIMSVEQEPISAEGKSISLIFTPAKNCLYGLADEPEQVFVFDHVEMEAKKN